MNGILKDIRTGALPRNEIPGFVAWLIRVRSDLIRKAFWAVLILATVGTLLALALRG